MGEQRRVLFLVVSKAWSNGKLKPVGFYSFDTLLLSDLQMCRIGRCSSEAKSELFLCHTKVVVYASGNKGKEMVAVRATVDIH